MTIKEDLQNSPASSHWEKIGVKHHHGLNIPLFALHSEKSSGIGEYLDLLPLIPWCKEIGFDIIQLLPLNDTGHETSPYSALSANALNPIHLSLSQLPFNESLSPLLDEGKNLNRTERVDYRDVHHFKESYLRKYYHVAAPYIQKEKEYQDFIETNRSWLQGYALFKTLRILTQWQSWENWKPELKDPSQNMINTLVHQYREEVDFHIFLQFLCFLQLRQVRAVAQKNGLFLKGDIPILINRDSADVWLNRSLFTMQYSAGAPPDAYSREGQKWGFPIYNWQAAEQTDYSWWKFRLKYATQFYEVYRLDHVVGFFRIWAIPLPLKGTDGQFIPENTKEWIPQGNKIMRMMLENSSMLPIGEDLGMVPHEVRNCLQSLGISGTKVMRWERKWTDDQTYIPINEYLPASMTTVSTHDSETVTQWWRDQPEEAKEYAKEKGWNYSPQITERQLFHILYDSHHTSSLFHINLLNEYLALVPGMTRSQPDDERINIPNLVSDRNWTYRFIPSVEEMISNPQLKNLMLTLIKP